MVRIVQVLILGLLIAAGVCAPALARDRSGVQNSEVSAQQRRAEPRRAPTRIEVYPLRGPLRRECVAVYTERWIPQWGGNVIYPGQRCWWTRG
jgi:hypothetical protein